MGLPRSARPAGRGVRFLTYAWARGVRNVPQPLACDRPRTPGYTASCPARRRSPANSRLACRCRAAISAGRERRAARSRSAGPRLRSLLHPRRTYRDGRAPRRALAHARSSRAISGRGGDVVGDAIAPGLGAVRATHWTAHTARAIGLDSRLDDAAPACRHRISAFTTRWPTATGSASSTSNMPGATIRPSWSATSSASRRFRCRSLLMASFVGALIAGSAWTRPQPLPRCCSTPTGSSGPASS